MTTVDRGDVERMRDEGHGWHTVARRLNAEGVPTPSGHGQWHAYSAARAFDPGVRASYTAYQREYRRRTRARARRREA